MANLSISLEGIDQAIVDLNYRPTSIKQKAIMAIRSFYLSEESIKELDSIDTDKVIKLIWDVGDNFSKIKSKRRNFSSLRSSINADLKKLLKKDKNPENIIVTESNIFDLTQEAKEDLLGSFSGAFKKGNIDLEQAASLLETMTEFLDKINSEKKDVSTQDITDKIKTILNKITEDILGEDENRAVKGTTAGKELDGADGFGADNDLDIIDETNEEIEKIELDEDEEIEEVDEEDDFEEIDDIDDSEELEEIEGLDDDELIELDDDEELEEVDAPEDDLEEIELDDDDELEEIEIDEDELLEEEDQEIGDDTSNDDDLDIIDETNEEIEKIELDEDEEIEEVDEEDDFEEIDDIDDNEELEEIEDLDDDELIELDDDEELEEIDAPEDDIEEIELDDDEELEEVDELDDEEQKALEEFREKRELSEQFDKTLGEREKKYNKYVKVPEGLYTVGTRKGLKSTLELQQFDMPEVYIGIYPVTNSLFEIFIEETGYITSAEKKGFGRVYYSKFKKNSKGSTWNKSSGSQDVKGACWYQPTGQDSSLHGKRNHPVVQISVDDAFMFASWIGRRLPTEAEWESAARTDLGYKYPWGNKFDPKALNLEQSGLSDTSSVDDYDTFANEFKIIDMLGNVMEWTSDMESPPFKSSNSIKYCVAKGGAWNVRDDVTISSRILYKPGFTSNTIGFRCISEIFL